MNTTHGEWMVFGHINQDFSRDLLGEFEKLSDAVAFAYPRGLSVENRSFRFANQVFYDRRVKLYREAIEELLTIPFRPRPDCSSPTAGIIAVLERIDAIRAANPIEDLSGNQSALVAATLERLLVVVQTEISGAVIEQGMRLRKNKRTR